MAVFKSGKRDSNPRPSAWEADALPTELLPHFNTVGMFLLTRTKIQFFLFSKVFYKNLFLKWSNKNQRKKSTPLATQ